MTTALLTRRTRSRSSPQPQVIGPEVNGLLMTLREFDRAEFDRDHRFELVNGVCIVSPPPDENEREPNDELGFALRDYQRGPNGHHLNATLSEHTIETATERRRADRRPGERGVRAPRTSAA